MKESKHLELKETVTNTFLKTVSAFSNYDGGEIFFGIQDDGTILGIKDPEQVCLSIENKMNDSIHPNPEYSLDINQKTQVIHLSVKEGSFKPYLYNGKAYKRHDTSTIEVDQMELRRLILEGSNRYYEKLPYQNDPDEHLTFAILEQELIEKMKLTEVNQDTFRTLDLYTEEGKFNNAAGLLADQNHFYGMDIVRFGEDINHLMDRETFTGCSVLKQYHGAVLFFKKYYRYEVIDGVERSPVELVPESACREPVANALIHRLWDVDAHIRIEMYPEEIRIISPGGLPQGLTEEEFLRGNISALRNPVLGNLFFRLHYIEMFGTGIRRILLSYKGRTVQPSFEIYGNSISVNLPVLTKKPSLTRDEQTVYDVLSPGRQFASSEIT